jgi:hypothetical protein
LLAERAEVAGQAEALQGQLRQTLIDLDHVNYTIPLFDPDAALDEVKPKPMPPRHAAFKGQVARAILSMLRASKAPIDSHTVTLRLLGRARVEQCRQAPC